MKKMEDLRQILFLVLDGLIDNTIHPEKASAIVSVSNCLIDSAKVEIDLVKTIGAIQGSGFIELPLSQK